MTIYRENILDIIDNWNGYPLEDPCPETPHPAINAGVVELKCFINNVCPFYKSGYKEDSLVFNEATFKRIQPWLPDDLRYALNVTPGTQGMHFAPRWVFRHNYIYQKKSNYEEILEILNIGAELGKIGTVNDRLYTWFDVFYDEITKVDSKCSSGVEGVDRTRYKAEQSWVVEKSIFDPDSSVDGAGECNVKAKWTYYGKKASNNRMSGNDIVYDYTNDCYAEDIANREDKYPFKVKKGKDLIINRINVQMPVQNEVLDNQNVGVHWRLTKRTPLFRGEDFFIRFYKEANETISNPDKKGVMPFPSEFSRYWPLDITRDEEVNINSDGDPPIMRKINYAVSSPSKENKTNKESDDDNVFNFYNQSYYIIELGIGDFTNNYFIIITEKSNPIFVNFVSGISNIDSISATSKKFSEFTKISGEQLINAKWFDITVRNHLGTIVIQFRGDGINPPPWVIKRWDWVPEIESVTNNTYLKDKVSALFVPRGRMSLMGGNLRCGFIFGPLQYEVDYLSIIYPPREMTNEDEDMKLAFTYSGKKKKKDPDPDPDPDEGDGDWNKDGVVDELDELLSIENAEKPNEPEEAEEVDEGETGIFSSSPFFLPAYGKHDILFSSTDIYLQDFYKHVIPVGGSAINQPLFMQDAQFYSNYYESNNGVSRKYKYGGFLYGETIKDFSDIEGQNVQGTGRGEGIVVRTSNITVCKYRYMNSFKTKQQAFDVLIGMMAGDHIFTNLYWDRDRPPFPKKETIFLDRPDFTKFADDEWFIPACKTPILTSLRLIAHESEYSRWNDGTRKNKGIDPYPDFNYAGCSPYFLDATDHVMTFSDSWSASGFSEIEHTGTLNFYLNRGIPVENNVTDALLSLQNKTFYIEIWAGYNRECLDGLSSYSRQSGLFKLFTGLCHGGKIDYQYGKNIMSCKLVDYTEVLKGMRFFNSPWFDGVKDINCIHEIMRMVGFRDNGKYDPGSLIRLLSESTMNQDSCVFYHHFDGRAFKMDPYALPSAYNRLDQPAFKFNDGDPLSDAIAKIAKRAGKVFFFDQCGIAHYENFQDMIQNDYLGRVPLLPLYYFTTNPEIYPGQLIFNKLARDYDVQGIINHIKIMSNTSDYHLLIGDELNWSSMENPESEGFIGYMKTAYQQEGMFGSKSAMMDTIKKYSVAFRPKVKSTFETYGVPLRSNDIIQVNGENTRVIKVNHNIGAEKNQWWMEVETEKYQTIQASRSVL